MPVSLYEPNIEGIEISIGFDSRGWRDVSGEWRFLYRYLLHLGPAYLSNELLTEHQG